MGPPEPWCWRRDILIGDFDHKALIDPAGNGNAAAGRNGKRS
jgi:hypothetical protein